MNEETYKKYIKEEQDAINEFITKLQNGPPSMMQRRQSMFNSLKKIAAIDLQENVLLDKYKYKRSEVLSDLIHIQDKEDIIIFSEDCGLFLLLKTYNDITQYLIHDNMYRFKAKSNYQIIFDNIKQKIIFGYSPIINNGEHDIISVNTDLEIITKTIQTYFHAEYRIEYNEMYKWYQIVINKYVNNFKENYDIFLNFKQEIQKNYLHISQKLQLWTINIDIHTQRKYIYNKIGNNTILKDILNSLLTVFEISVPNDDKIIIDNYYTNKINQNIMHDITLITNNWIDEHPPINKQSTDKYYKLYEHYLKEIKLNPLSIQCFSNIVKLKNYKKSSNGSIRIWLKQ